MISHLWIVFATEDGFEAKEWIQGHDGMKRIVPHFSEERLNAGDLAGLQSVLESRHLEKMPARIHASIKRWQPELLEVWF